MNRNRFKYNKPKSKNGSRGSWIEVRRGNNDNVKLIQSIKESCLNEQALWQNYQIASTSLYKSNKLQQNFAEKEKELEGLLKEKPQQTFAFGLVRTKVHADEICETSAFQRCQVLHVPLGDPSKGVNVVKHADVLMTYAFKKRCTRPWLIVYRIMVGRSKNVKPRFVSQAPQVSPTPNADSHLCKEVDMKSELVCEQLNQSQIFLFELDSKGRPIKHPRHCLPYAVVSCKQREVPLPLTLPNSSNLRQNARKPDDEAPQQSTRSDSTRQETISSLSQEEGVALSRYLEEESLTITDIDSNQLDSKLNDIKKEREDVMKKLKAIQSMREALTSGSCSSGSEQEIDKALSEIRESSGKVDRKIARSMSSSADSKSYENERSSDCLPSSQSGNAVGGRQEPARRQERIASTSGWRDPYHWTPYQRNTNDAMQCSSAQGRERNHELDYYNTDEQSEMFDLEEMIYAGKIPAQKKTILKPPDDYKSPGRFHDDVLQLPKPEKYQSDEENQPCQMPQHDDKDKMQAMIGSDAENRNKHSSSPSVSTFHQGGVPTSEVTPQDYNSSTFESSSVAGGDNQLTSNIQVQDMDIDESSQSSNSHGSYGNPSTIATYQTINPPAFTSQSFPTVYSSVSYNNSSFGLSYTNSTYNSIPQMPQMIDVPPMPRIDVSPMPRIDVPPMPRIDVPVMSTVPYNNAASAISQDYSNSFNYEPSHEGAQTNLNISQQQYSTQEPPNSDPLGPPGIDVDTSYQPPNSTPTSSSGSDFSSSKVVSRGADGRLRLTPQSSQSPVEMPNVVFRRPPSPAEEQFPEGTMSPPGPYVPHFEYESNLMQPETALEDCPPAKVTAKVGASSLSDGTHSAVEALQKELMDSNNPTRKLALQMVMNTLLAKTAAPPVEDAIKHNMASMLSLTRKLTSMQSAYQGDVQSNANFPVKMSSDASVPKSKAKVVKMFHGHPLIKKGAKKPPRTILLEQMSNGPQPVDPRPARSSLFGRKFDVSLSMVPWVKSVSPVKKQPKVTDHREKNQEGALASKK
ncbi:uncharacterized protein [Amphiura filiformis]|uniref:uncharacterized protein n=1 Tax=Amphiura filiformis TaxID=82378 RepID=UPI003B20EA53